MLNVENLNVFYHNQIKRLENFGFTEKGITSIQTNDDVLYNGDLLIPGFIDLQIYGAGGELFSANPTLESIDFIENQLLKEGTTGFLICLATNTPEVFNRCIEVMKTHQKNAKNCWGLHLEGPFINPKKRGAHVLEYIRKASLDEIKALLDFGEGTVKMITLAPELQDDEIITYLIDHNIIVSLGHSDATFEEATAAYNKGVQTTTHLFNAMSPILHRRPGIPTAVFNHPSAMASIIADGMHVDFEVVKMAHKQMKERLFLITDAVTDCNTGPYQHKAVDGKFVMPDGTLSGSSLTMLQAVKNCVGHCNIDLPTAIAMATTYPSKLSAAFNRASALELGNDSNFLILDRNLELKSIFFNGKEIK
ncbi:N-acetylglucosamine-6-phosphate deacetylase [Pedobacter sp.]|uniref:N-acetylglucosamine-6-phosphate deacetylase n=1 Tax=Pedobacter sp. TaxID=1411316 RepID=UPI00396C6B7A